MPFVKVVKNKAYFKRYQTKFRRRREGKTDYKQRRALVVNDKNKYHTPKFRFVVRLTNTKVICQVIYAEINGDKTIASAYSTELARYGLTTGLKNYAAAYCTGLLCARRLLTKMNLADAYSGNEDVTAEVISTEDDKRTYWVAELDEERRPFRAYLDVGVRPTTTGARVFGALKGAVDGGLDIPHNEKRFPGYDREAKEYAADFHRDRIFGQHVAEYMRKVQEEDEAAYKAQFSKYVAAGVNADGVEDLYTKVHAAIRANPAPAESKPYVKDAKFKHATKTNLKQRKNRVQQKKAWRIYALTRQLEEAE
jgi:large subunit ribosomal protein L5e